MGVRRRGGWTLFPTLIVLSGWPVICLSAQCPDGSPPPCGSARTVVAPPARSVAVLYFENLSRDTADAYIADGFTEEITARLGQIGRLAVRSRTAARRLRNTPAMSPAAIGRALNARYLVSGSVRTGAARLRVTVELVQAATGTRVWGDQFDRTTTDLLAIEEDVARAVATGIAGQLLPSEQVSIAARVTHNPEAYDHYLRGNRLMWRGDETSVLTAIAEYEAALRLDSGFTAARGRLAFAYGQALNWSYRPESLPAESLFARGAAAAERAIREDSTASDAWLGQGMVLFFGGRPQDLETAVASGKRAVELNPGDDAAHQWYGTVLRRVGRFADAERELRLARVVNPWNIQAVADVGFIAYEERRFVEAQQWYDSAIALDSTFSSQYALRARVRAELHDLPGALADAAHALQVAVPSERGRLQALLAEMEARSGHADRGRERLQEAFADLGWPGGVPPTTISVRNTYDPALAATAMGMPDVALSIVQRAQPQGPWLWSYLIFPGFDPLRADPRFRKIFDAAKPPDAPDVPQ